MGLSPKTGKALDISGAFAFLAFAGIFTVLDVPIFASAFAAGSIAWAFSWGAWDAINDGNDALSYRRSYWAVVWGIISAVFFIIAFVVWMLT